MPYGRTKRGSARRAVLAVRMITRTSRPQPLGQTHARKLHPLCSRRLPLCLQHNYAAYMQIPLSLPSTSKTPQFTPRRARPPPTSVPSSARNPAPSTSLGTANAPRPTRTLTPPGQVPKSKPAIATASHLFTPRAEPTGALVQDSAGYLRLARSSAGPHTLGITEAHVHAGLGVGLLAVLATVSVNTHCGLSHSWDVADCLRCVDSWCGGSEGACSLAGRSEHRIGSSRARAVRNRRGAGQWIGG